MVPTRRALTYDQYLALEQETGVRHEWLRGEAWAMAGGTQRHSAVATNLTGELYAALRGKPCRLYNSDAKVRIDDTDLSTYPNLSVVCGELARSPLDRHASTNPTVLIEVLSPSTERWDRGGKFHHYRRLASLQHYVLVSVAELRVEVFTRADDETWNLRVVEGTGTVDLTAIDVTLDLAAIYADLPAEPTDDAEGAPDPTV